MRAMRRAGNSMAQFRFDIRGTVCSGEELADYFDRKKIEEASRTSGSKSSSHADQRGAGLDAFEREDFLGALRVSRSLAEETRSRKEWFNVFSAQIHLKELRGALGALQSMRSIPAASSFEDCLTPAEDQFHAARLFAEAGSGLLVKTFSDSLWLRRMWLLYGFPLVLLGAAWIWAGASVMAGESYDIHLIAFGIVCALAGAVSLFKSHPNKTRILMPSRASCLSRESPGLRGLQAATASL